MQRKNAFDLSRLVKFNPAIIYTYQAEYAESGEESDRGSLAYGLNTIGQLHDLYDAYFYAQESILPEIARHGIANITPAMLVQWIKNIHSCVARKLAKTEGETAGCYINSLVLLDRYGRETGEVMELLTHKKISIHAAVNALVQLGLTRGKAMKVAELFMRYQRDETRDSELIHYRMSSNRSHRRIVSFRLYNAYFRKRLSEEDVEIIEDFMLFSMPYYLIEDGMKEYAEKLLASWRQCDPSNREQVCDLAYQAFRDLTDIHPFFNANGRTATCMMNTILASLGLPSIVMPESHEEETPHSAYSTSIMQIDSHPATFKKMINDRIQKALDGNPYRHDNLSKIVPLRVSAYTGLSMLLALIPEAEVKTMYKKMLEECMHKACNKVARFRGTNHDSSPGMNLLSLESVTFLDEAVKAVLAKHQVTALPVSVARKYDTAEKKEIIASLSVISRSQDAWKLYEKDSGLFAVCMMPNREDAHALIQKMMGLGISELELKRNPQTDQPAVCLNAINLVQLRELVKQLPEQRPVVSFSPKRMFG